MLYFGIANEIKLNNNKKSTVTTARASRLMIGLGEKWPMETNVGNVSTSPTKAATSSSIVPVRSVKGCASVQKTFSLQLCTLVMETFTTRCGSILGMHGSEPYL